MPELLILQPSVLGPPARLGKWLAAASARLDVVCPAAGDPLPATLDGRDGVVCMGGEMNALDDAGHPWLADCRSLLAEAVRRRTPTLGVCLGSQLLAAATGGRVTRAAGGPEVGPLVVARRDTATADPLLAGLPLSPLVLQFHADEVAELPPGAVLLASSPRCANQAFRVGAAAWGIQGHFETTPELVAQWAAGAPALAAHARPGALDHEHLVAEHATWSGPGGRSPSVSSSWRPARSWYDGRCRWSSGPAEPRLTTRVIRSGFNRYPG